MRPSVRKTDEGREEEEEEEEEKKMANVLNSDDTAAFCMKAALGAKEAVKLAIVSGALHIIARTVWAGEKPVRVEDAREEVRAIFGRFKGRSQAHHWAGLSVNLARKLWRMRGELKKLQTSSSVEEAVAILASLIPGKSLEDLEAFIKGNEPKRTRNKASPYEKARRYLQKNSGEMSPDEIRALISLLKSELDSRAKSAAAAAAKKKAKAKVA